MALGSVTTNEPNHKHGDSRPMSMTMDGRLRVSPNSFAVVTASTTRPADTTAYAAGDLVANNVAAGSVNALQFTVAKRSGGQGVIRRPRIRKSGTVITNASFRLHLYSSNPTAANGDNGVWLTNKAADYLGSFDIVVDRAFNDGAASVALPAAGSEIQFVLSSGQTVFGLLEARAAYTPISGEVFTVSLDVAYN